MTSPVDLDDLNAIQQLDSEDVLGAVERFADQCREGWEIGLGAEGLPEASSVESVIVLGMGGSGVSGDVLQAVVEPRLAVPLRTIKSYGPLPEWVGRNSLVFAVSYSGSTEETVAGLDEARARGCRIVAVSSGGPLAERAAPEGFAHVRIPQGHQPRASLGYLSMPLLAVLVKVGLVPDMQEEVDDAVAVLCDIASRCHRKHGAPDNPAKALAEKLRGKVPVVYGGYGLGSVAAYRFKCDLNEYAKTPAFAGVLPELDHNEIVGWKGLSELTSENFINVLLIDPKEHPRVALRFEITRGLISEALPSFCEVTAEGEGPLARLLSLILVTQLASIYLALSYGEDPGPVEVITALKNELASR
ncbi:MAG TPA: bifunctional phosphoglucose/phosphomannose isomerase [Actinomycetota bacterium]|nr:bifunctional phosphoglucose/phosphomannose isomerase [Actinomycetota bacterium]